MILEATTLLSSAVLGIFLGSQLVEALLFLPFWKAMTADAFFDFYKRYGRGIHRFYAPLTILATILPVVSTLIYFSSPTDQQTSVLYLVLGVSAVAFFSTFFLYFKSANRKFSQRAISDNDLAAELRMWGNWHWGRIYLEAIALISTLILIFLN